jgi:hypothetical protein
MSTSTATISAPAIQTVLDKNYGPDGEGFYPINKVISEELAVILNGERNERTERRITNLIWNNYAGGGLAEATAQEIMAAV